MLNLGLNLLNGFLKRVNLLVLLRRYLCHLTDFMLLSLGLRSELPDLGLEILQVNILALFADPNILSCLVPAPPFSLLSPFPLLLPLDFFRAIPFPFIRLIRRRIWFLLLGVGREGAWLPDIGRVRLSF